jgi:hypothetical protein
MPFRNAGFATPIRSHGNRAKPARLSHTHVITEVAGAILAVGLSSPSA